MSTPTNAPPGPEAHAPSGELSHQIRQGEVLFVVLVLLSGAGIAVTSFSPARGFHYWLAMVPLFGGVSAFLAYSRARARGESPAGPLRAQLFHWVGLLGAFQLVFLMKTAGQLEYDALGLVALTVLALTTFLAGVHADWRLCLVGALLGGIVVAGAFTQQFVWALVVPALLLLAVLGIGWRLRGRRPGSVADAG